MRFGRLILACAAWLFFGEVLARSEVILITPAGYLPGADFDATFGVNGFNPNISLLTALNTGGGGKNALARHAVAALLNSVHSGVDYGLSSAEVISLVQSAFASGDFESAKNRLAGLNEADCVLPNDNSFKL